MNIHLKQFTKFSNAGDVASSYIVSRLTNTNVITVDAEPLCRPNLIAIGSILHWSDSHSIIWGSGLISSNIVLQTAPAQLVAVRGQLTRAQLLQLGIEAPVCVGDPGILISDFFSSEHIDRRNIGIVPHYVDSEHAFVAKSLDQGALLIDPLSPIEGYLAAMAACEVIISSSLHGIIFAHSFGIPSVWIDLSTKVIGEGFKFRDYYSSIGFQPSEIPRLTAADEFNRVVDRACLPKYEIDREALRASLIDILPLLESE